MNNEAVQNHQFIGDSYLIEKQFDGFSCPLSTQIMENPVIASDGHSYQKNFIEKWFYTSNKSPLTNMVLPNKNLIPNHNLKKALNSLKQKYSNKNNTQKNNKNQYQIHLGYIKQMKFIQDKVQSYMGKLYKENLVLKRNLVQQRQSHQNTIIQAKRIVRQQQQRKNQFKQEIQLLQNKLFNAYKIIQNCKCQKKEIKINNFIKPIQCAEKLQQIQFQEQEFIPNFPFQNIDENFSQFLKQYPTDIIQLLKGKKKISISPDKKTEMFQQHFQFIDLSSKGIIRKNFSLNVGGHLISKQQLPMSSKQSFYFCIRILYLEHNNDLQIGITYPKNGETDFTDKNGILYSLWIPTVTANNQTTPKLPFHTNKIQFPSQCIVLVNFQDKTISWIYNKKLQVKIPLDNKMIIKDRKYFAKIYFIYDFKIQFL